MPWFLAASIALHAGLLLVGILGLPRFSAPPEPPEVVEVTLVSPAAPVIELSRPVPPPPPARPDPQDAVLAAPDVGETPDAPVTPPPPVERVSPQPAPEPLSPLPDGPTLVPPVTEDVAVAEPEVQQPEPEPQAPSAASPETVTEAVETEEQQSLAVLRSPIPARRPQRGEVVETVEPEPEPAVATPADEVPEPDPAPTPPDPIADAIAAALAAASQSDAPQSTAPLGSQLTIGERDALRLAVSPCWNFAALSTEAARVTVVVGMDMGLDGRPVAGSLRMVSHNGPNADVAAQSYEVARRAILRCQGTGYPLPADKYDQWKEIEMTFNPERMRLR
ncbi:MAG: energy transducer TonB [Pseudomonadota bacterium]